VQVLRDGFVDPIPDAETFAKMYARTAYHDAHYAKCEGRDYQDSARLLTRFLPLSAQVLDYGCGVGGFLSALKAEGFVPTGVEFDKQAARAAARNTGCPVSSVDEFRAVTGPYDALHLGDMLEHPPNPLITFRELPAMVKPGGILFVEGPLEINPGPVYWAARLTSSR